MRWNRDHLSEYVFGSVPRQQLNRLLGQLGDLSVRVCGRRLRISDLRSSFANRWLIAGGTPDAFAMITGRALVIDKRLLSGIQQFYSAAAKIQESLEV